MTPQAATDSSRASFGTASRASTIYSAGSRSLRGCVAIALADPRSDDSALVAEELARFSASSRFHDA
jgi:hypothetical protein